MTVILTLTVGLIPKADIFIVKGLNLNVVNDIVAIPVVLEKPVINAAKVEPAFMQSILVESKH